MTVTIESKTYLPEEDVAGRFTELVTELEASSGAALTINGETIDLPPAVAKPFFRSWMRCVEVWLSRWRRRTSV